MNIPTNEKNLCEQSEINEKLYLSKDLLGIIIVIFNFCTIWSANIIEDRVAEYEYDSQKDMNCLKNSLNLLLFLLVLVPSDQNTVLILASRLKVDHHA